MPQPARSADAPVAVVQNTPGLLRALQQRRESVADQYQSILAERGRVGQERLNAQARGDAEMVREYSATIERLGAQLKSIEATLARADQQIEEAMKAPVTADEAPAAPAAVTLAPSGPNWPALFEAQRAVNQRVMLFGGSGLLLLALLAWRFGVAKGKRMTMDQLRARTDLPRDDERLQQAVDAIAIEVERLSEGQRFLNNLLAARRPEREVLPATPRITPSDVTRVTPH
jgi:hypothetical protein